MATAYGCPSPRKVPVAQPAIQTEQLTRDFGAGRAVDHLDFCVATGTVFSLVGPPGAGKTTVLRLLLGLLPPTSGTARVLGFDVRSQGAAIRSQTGALVESAGLYDRLTVYENLDLYARIWHLSAVDRAARIFELLMHFDLWERRDELVGSWGPELRQKLGLVRSLLHRPRLLLLDEPMRGVEPAFACALQADLAALVTHEGVTILFTSNDLGSAAPFCQAVGILENGRLLAVGTPQDLYPERRGPKLEITGRGFTQETVDLVRRRRDVRGVAWSEGTLVVELADEASSAPVVNLLVESGAAVDQVRSGGVQAAFPTLLEGSHAHKSGR